MSHFYREMNPVQAKQPGRLTPYQLPLKRRSVAAKVEGVKLRWKKRREALGQARNPRRARQPRTSIGLRFALKPANAAQCALAQNAAADRCANMLGSGTSARTVKVPVWFRVIINQAPDQLQGQVFVSTKGKRAGASNASMPVLGDQEYVSIVGRSGDARNANKLESDDERTGDVVCHNVIYIRCSFGRRFVSLNPR